MSATQEADSSSPGQQQTRTTDRVTEFCDYTTAHGLSRFSSQSSRLGKLIWLIFLIGTYAGFTFHLYTLFDRFISAPVLTTITASLPFEFPDVYICPAHTITMSAAVNDIPDGAIKDLLNYEHVTELFLLSTSFDKENGPDAFQLKPSVLALSDTLISVERSLMEEFEIQVYSNGSECRVSQSGEEYTGNVSTVPVYTALYRSVSITSGNNMSLEPYVTRVPCIGWNEAARRLLAQNVSLADRILAMNYSDSDNRCKSPVGLQMSDFIGYSAAADPKMAVLGCYSFNHSGVVPAFAVLCLSYYYMTHELCLECCSRKHFSHMALSGDDCHCGNESDLSLMKLTAGACDRYCWSSDSSQSCGGKSALTVLQIQYPESKPLIIPTGNKLTSLMGGPYCFYNDSGRRLSAYYCRIPFCVLPGDKDCVVSGAQAVTPDATQLTLYTGRVNRTAKGWPCMPWNKARAQWKEMNRFDQLDILTADTDGTSDHNFCRAFLSVSQIRILTNDLLIQGPFILSSQPACFFNTAEGSPSYGTCSVPPCFTEVPSIAGVVRDGVGSMLLARQFGSDLSTGLTDCSFAGKPCTKHDFLNVLHPELGVCHRFLKDRFITGLNTVQLANAKLSITFFTDSTDSYGRTFSNMSKMEKPVDVRDGAKDTTEFAFKALIVPPGSHPRASAAITVDPAQHMEVQLRFDKFTARSVATRPCNSSRQSISYRMFSWTSSNSSGNSAVLAKDSSAVLTATDWRAKLSKLRSTLMMQGYLKGESDANMIFEFPTQQDCINSYQVQKVIDSCKCLPTSLPIPTHLLSNYSYCFDSTDALYLHQIDRCIKSEMSRLNQYQHEATAVCQPMCQTRSYSIRQTPHPWPKINREDALDFLTQLAAQNGYPQALQKARGVASLYYTYVFTLSTSGIPLTNKTTMDLLKFDYQLRAVENRLAKLTVQALSASGQEIVEDEAYPAKNLLADIGGALGLWSGVSVLTVCEILELAVFLGAVIMAKILSCRRRGPQHDLKGVGSGTQSLEFSSVDMTKNRRDDSETHF